MARMPGAEWRPIQANFRRGAMQRPIMGQVEHHIVGSGENAWELFNNPDTQKSAHFIVYTDGGIVQCVDTNDVAYAACNANWTGWVQIENESPAVDDPSTPEDEVWAPLTNEQVDANHRILQWLHDTEDVPMQVTDDINVGGVAYHSMNPGPCKTHWGSTGCPGQAIIAQRADIVSGLVKPAVVPVPPKPPVPVVEDDEEIMQVAVVNGVPHVYIVGTDSAVWVNVGEAVGQWTRLGGTVGEPVPHQK